MPTPFIYLTEGGRIFVSSLRQRLAPKTYSGNAEEICKQIVNDCWNGRYFQASATNFPQFWTRDFGICTSSLLQLEYRKEVYQTLRYALNCFQHYTKITTTITPRGMAYDFPIYAVDSLPWLIHSIKISKFPYYHYKDFLNKEIRKFYTRVIHPSTGLVYPHLHFSSMKDLAVRKSSCYDNCMVAMLTADIKEMKLLENPFSKVHYPELIKKHFWNGNYFYDDLSKQNYVAGDANLFPFLLGIIKERDKMQAVLASIQQHTLDAPFPLKYTSSRNKINFVWQEKLALKDYESNAVWTHIGLLFIQWLQQFDKGLAERYKQQYTEMIERHKSMVEVFSADGKSYKSWFYCADRSMLWAANYLTL